MLGTACLNGKLKNDFLCTLPQTRNHSVLWKKALNKAWVTLELLWATKMHLCFCYLYKIMLYKTWLNLMKNNTVTTYQSFLRPVYMYMNFTWAELSSREVRCLDDFKMGNSIWVGLARNNGCEPCMSQTKCIIFYKLVYWNVFFCLLK